MEAGEYEFRVRGRLDDARASRLAEFNGDLVAAETVLRGRLADQSQLQGMLARLQEQGLELLEVKRVTGRR
ncbi:MAG TPA: hypothetical protein VI318_01035 [Baekduia sp.]